MSASRPFKWVQIRLIILGVFTLLFGLALGGRLFRLTVSEHDLHMAAVDNQRLTTVPIDSMRGAIRDRNGRNFATSVGVKSISCKPYLFTGSNIVTAASKLSNCLSISEALIVSKLETNKRFAWLERKASPGAVVCVRSLNLSGIEFSEAKGRFYPKRNLASQILGFVGVDNKGLSGVEYALEEDLGGEPGLQIVIKDARRQIAARRILTKSLPGSSAYLTIDENLQYIAETELKAAIAESGAESGMALLMRSRTGEILAMASLPSFNPNRYSAYPQDHWRNRFVTDVYEPGSTFKVVIAAAAIAENVTNEEERIDTGGGSIRIGSNIIRDPKGNDFLTFQEVVEKSSNVGMIRIGQRLGKRRMDDYIRAFGFGEKTGVLLPGESRGILRRVEDWGHLTQASISFGQEVGVTPIQMLAAVNVIASSGYLIKPRLLLGLGNEHGQLKTPKLSESLRQVVTEDVAHRVKELLVGVVKKGTGQRAQIEGYQVAGKTGTAQKAEAGGYSKTDYIASFTGFAPAYSPEITALIIMDSPKGDYSGASAAGVFSSIVGRSLRYLNVPTTETPVLHLVKSWPKRPKGPRESLEPKAIPIQNINIDLNLSSRIDDCIGAPGVLGLSARDAVEKLLISGIVPEVEGAGWVYEQSPVACAEIGRGGGVKLFLSSGRESGIRSGPVFVNKKDSFSTGLLDKQTETLNLSSQFEN